MKAKIFACIEVCAVFVLMVFLFHGAQSTLLAGQTTRAVGGRPLLGYALLLAASLALFLLRARPQPRMLSLPRLKYQLDITACGFFPVFILSVVLSRIDWTRWTGALLVSVIAVGLLIWFARWVRNKPIREVAEVDSSAVLLLAPPVFTKIAGVLASVVYFYGMVALSEELLFRGYIQTRLNSVMGRPFHLFGIPWGWGWLISSILFGLWHLGWGTGALAWPHVLWTIAAGLIFGLAREKSEGILAPSILHGIMNYGPQAALYDLFF